MHPCGYILSHREHSIGASNGSIDDLVAFLLCASGCLGTNTCVCFSHGSITISSTPVMCLEPDMHQLEVMTVWFVDVHGILHECIAC